MIATRGMDRGPYFKWGCALMAVKYNLDRLIAWFGFHRSWYFWNYLKPHGVDGIDAIPPDDQLFYLVLLLTSLPFLILGLFLTLRRLRSAGLPLALCLLFFVPVINLVFFIVLALLPEKDAPPEPSRSRGWMAWLPTSAGGSALASVVLVGLLGMGMTCLSTEVLQNYGWGLFVALPFAMGLVSVLIYAGPQKRSFGSCMSVAVLTVFFCGLGLLMVAVEGVICLLMAAPIGFTLALLGGMVGYVIVDVRNTRIGPGGMALLLLSVPFTMGMEKRADEAPPLLSVTTSVVINAPPEVVWAHVISFPVIPPQRDWILRTGVAYPTEARIDGRGVGAIRHCIFTTGEFVEPIEVWDEPRCLRFSVADQPEPMEELSPYPHLKTPHLHGYLQSQEGELRLTALPGGKTLLAGTTWYTDRIWPSRYWQLWSDLMIHHIHLRVLNHIKNLSERP
jgi:uncharacterized membrane protein YhaH (DUF805 family)